MYSHTKMKRNLRGMSEFDPKNCPLGLVHQKEIEYTKDLLDMAIKRIEEKIETGFSSIDSKFNGVDKRFDGVDERLNSL